MAFTVHFSATFDWTGDKFPDLKYKLLRNNELVRGDTLADWSTPENPTEQVPHIGNQYNRSIDSGGWKGAQHYKFKVDIDDSIENDYTLVIEHSNAVYPDDYIKGNFGVNIKYLDICGVDLCDLIHRRGHVYLDCTNNPYYTYSQINNDNRRGRHNRGEVFIVEDFRLLNFRHGNVQGNNPRVFNNIMGEFKQYTGYYVTDNGYIIKGKNLYYDCTKDIFFIADNANNPNLYTEGDRLIHHIPNDATISLNGKWMLNFKTPFYAWVSENIFGNDLA